MARRRSGTKKFLGSNSPNFFSGRVVCERNRAGNPSQIVEGRLQSYFSLFTAPNPTAATLSAFCRPLYKRKMAPSTPGSRDADTKKRKRDLSDKDGQTKRLRHKGSKPTNNGDTDSGDLRDNALNVLSQLKKNLTDDQIETELSNLGNSDPQATGWQVSAPMGGRMADIDPIFVEKEK